MYFRREYLCGGNLKLKKLLFKKGGKKVTDLTIDKTSILLKHDNVKSYFFVYLGVWGIDI